MNNPAQLPNRGWGQTADIRIDYKKEREERLQAKPNRPVHYSKGTWRAKIGDQRLPAHRNFSEGTKADLPGRSLDEGWRAMRSSAGAKHGARGGTRTRTPKWIRDFKSLASTDFATRAGEKSAYHVDLTRVTPPKIFQTL